MWSVAKLSYWDPQVNMILLFILNTWHDGSPGMFTFLCVLLEMMECWTTYYTQILQV